MSLVGTRPPTVDEWDKYELHHRARLATKPGLTGMWQVSGRSNITDLFATKTVAKLCELFDGETKVINCSENEDRSGMSEETIQKYLYSKLKTTSVTIIIITPQAINHKKDMWGRYDDWMYDEIRYSLEDRENLYVTSICFRGR